jgi:hypothetical protein
MPSKPVTTVEQAADWYNRNKLKNPPESIAAIARLSGRSQRAVKRAITVYEDLLKKNMQKEGVAMAQEELNKDTGEEDDDEDEEDADSVDGGDGAGEAAAPAITVSPPDVPPEPQASPQRRPKATVHEPRPRQRAPPRAPRPPPEEEPEEEPVDDGESIWRSQDSLLKRREAKLITMLKAYPKVDKKQIDFVRDLCAQDPTILDQPRMLFDMLADMEKLEPRMLRRIVDIVFAEQEPGFPDDMYAPPYSQTGYGGRTPNPYGRETFERSPYGSPPSQGDRYSYDRPPASPRAPGGMISWAEHERMIDLERRAALIEAENRRLRQENRTPPAPQPPPAPPREQPVEIKRPVLSPDGQQVLDYQYEKIPVDIYRQQLSEERYEKMIAMMTARNQPERPEQSPEVAALKDQVAALQKLIETKEKDKQLESLKTDIGAQMQSATKNMMELQKRTEAKLAEIEKGQGAGAPTSGIGDDAQIIVTEIKEGSALTRAALDRASGLMEKYMDMQVRAGTPNRPKKRPDRERYKEELDDEEVRILNEELPDGDVEDEGN